MDWSGDMLTVLYSHTKTMDDESRKGLKPFHLATNPDEPWMCPVTAIALLLFHGLWHSGGALFSGAAVAKNYAMALAEILKDPEVVKALIRAGVYYRPRTWRDTRCASLRRRTPPERASRLLFSRCRGRPRRVRK